MKKKAKKPKLIKPKKAKVEKIDGLNPKDIENLRRAIRQVWSWSYPRKLCIKRATNEEGFGVCELCLQITPKLYADHIEVMGDVLAPDYIERMFTESKNLQALCAKCHRDKTNRERKAAKILEDLRSGLKEIEISSSC